MDNQTTTAPKGANYLADWMTEIPTNCILSKGITGCGATTLSIEQAGHNIIAMPFTGLIDNKTTQYPKTLLGIYGRGDKTQEIREYLETHETLKIATTYDSLRKVCDTLEYLGFNPYEEAHLIVDEWHVLFNSYDFRHDGISRLLNTAPHFDKATYISATPIERKYFLDELKHLPEYKIIWPNAKPVKIRSHQVDNPLKYMVGVCRNKIAAGGDCNYHIFLNSIDDISTIIRTAKLTPENTRVICSQNEDNLRKNLDKLPNGFTISKALDDLKPISFYTSTCFEGQDIIDKNGRSFIVSNAKKDYTLMDISTTFIQICGRIRESKYNEEIVHFYDTSPYTDVSLEEFEQATYTTLKEAEEFAKWIDTAPERYKQDVFKQVKNFNEPYVKEKEGKIFVDYNLANYEIVNYKIVNNIYQCQANVISEQRQSGCEISDDTSYIAPEKIQLMAQYKLPFKELFELYCLILDNEPQFTLTPDYRLELIVYRNPLVKEAYDKLGREEVRRMNHHQSNIKRKLIEISYKSNDYKIVELINATFSHQTAIPAKKVKEELQKIYNQLGMENRKAKATDLENWYQIKKETKTIKGERVACITIIRSNFVRISKF